MGGILCINLLRHSCTYICGGLILRCVSFYPRLFPFLFFFSSFSKITLKTKALLNPRGHFRGTALRRSMATSTWTRAPITWPTSAKWRNGIIETRANCSTARATWSREARESFGRRTERRTRSFCSAAICAGQSATRASTRSALISLVWRNGQN